MSQLHASLKDHFLIAMPHMSGSGFANTVTYLCEHDEEGAMGLVINRPTEIKLLEIFDQLDLDHDSIIEPEANNPVYAGGPVQTERGFILHQSRKQTWDGTREVGNGLKLTTSKDILVSIANNEGPSDCLIALGYAGWGANQLEQELSSNCWLTVPATPEVLFDTPPQQRLEAAASLLGIRMDQLSGQHGHA